MLLQIYLGAVDVLLWGWGGGGVETNEQTEPCLGVQFYLKCPILCA